MKDFNALEWVKKNLDIISVYRIESLVGMPHSTLDKAVKGVRGLPKKWEGPLDEFVKDRVDIKNRKS